MRTLAVLAVVVAVVLAVAYVAVAGGSSLPVKRSYPVPDTTIGTVAGS